MRRLRSVSPVLAAIFLSVLIISEARAQVTLSAPASVPPGVGVLVSWSGIANPTAKDWIGLYTPGASDGSYQSWVYVSCSQTAVSAAASGSCVYGLPAASGTYEFRMFANDGLTRLAVSNPVTASALPVVSVAATTASVAENSVSSTGVFTVSRTGSTTAALTVNYTVSGSATPGSVGQGGADYVTLTGSVIIPAGSSSASIAVTPIDDTLAEGNETVVVTLSANAGYTLGSPSSATVTIVDDEPPPPTVSLAVTDGTATEGTAADTGVFTVSRTGSATGPLTVFYSIGGTATNGVDYQTLSGSVTIQQGQNSAPITVTTIDDNFVEGNETVVVTLSANAAYALGSPISGTVTIVDNDVPAGPSLAVNPSSVPLGSVVTVSWSGIANPTAKDWIGLYTPGASDGSYQSWVYVSCSRTAVSAAASGSCVYGLPAASGTYEFRMFANDGFTRLAVSNPVTASALPVVSVAATTASVAENSISSTGVFTVSRTGSTTAALTVNYTVSGSATPGSVGQGGADYVTLTGSVIIPAGSSSASIAVTPIDDTLAEGNETVVVTLSANAGYTLGSPSSATVTIVDDEPPPPTVSLAVTDGTATEGTAADTGVFTVSRTGSATGPLTVFYSIGGTATNGVDYQTLSGSVTIQQGQNSAPITVTTIDDNFVEGNETVVVTLSANAAYALGSPISGTVTIVDNDVPAGPSLAVNPSSVPLGSVVTVSWSGIANPTAKDWIGLYTPGASDGSYQSWVYVSCSRTAVSAAASGSCVYGLPAASGTYEFRMFANDGFTRLAVSNPVTASALPVVSVAATTASVAENSISSTGVFTVSRTGSTTAALTVNYTVSGSATPGSVGQGGADYVTLTGSVIIPAGSSSASIAVTPIDDTLAEGNETVVVTLSANAGYTLGSPSSATVTIVDDEPPPPTVSLAVTDGTATEGTAADTGVFTVSRTGSATGPLTVFYSIGGTATNGVDYQTLSGSVTIQQGQNSAPITVTTIDDNFVEGNETVVVTLSANAAYALGSPISGTVTIVDNDVPAGPSLIANPGIVAPGAVLTASWSGITSPTAKDWIGLYTPGAGDGSYQSWLYVSCSHTSLSSAASGSCVYGVPTVSGTYELRLFSNDGYTRLATSSPFAVTPLTTNLLITSPARDVSAAPNVATVSIARQECNTVFSIPYIQTNNALTVSAVPSNVPNGGGVKFVLNENLAGQAVQFSMSAPFKATFAALPKDEYRIDAYIVDSSLNVVAGALNHDYLTQIGIGDIYVAIGDSITEGYDGAAYNVPPYTSWLQAPLASTDYRNYPQCGIYSGAYQDHWQEASHHIMLNDRLEAYFDFPVFILNEGVAEITTNGYLSRMGDPQWQNRVTALQPNKWLIHLGTNDGGGSATFQSNMQNVINILKTTYGAMGDDIVLAVPQNKTNWQPYINNLISANGLTAGPDFNTFYLNNTNPPLVSGPHPNVAGHVQMARLWALSILSPKNLVAESVGSGQVLVSWDDLKLLEPTIAGYKVYYGANPGLLTSVVDVGSVTTTLINVSGSGTYYFAVQAYDNDLYSPNLTATSLPISLP